MCRRARAGLRTEADRTLRMARVLAVGGFTEEALPLVAKAIGTAAAVALAALGELAAGASVATPDQVRDLVGRGALRAAGGKRPVGALVQSRRRRIERDHRDGGGNSGRRRCGGVAGGLIRIRRRDQPPR